jgi:site-specific recombinase XerD
MKIQAALDDYLLAIRANGLKESTIKWYTSLLGAMVAWFQGRDLVSITTKELREYVVDLRERDSRYIDAPQKPVQEGGLAADSIKGHVTALHSFWEFCAAEYQIDNPMAGIKREKRGQPKPKAIDQSDFVRLFNVTGDNPQGKRDRAILCFLADTGCRLGGLLSLDMNHLYIEDRKALVYEKGNTHRMVVFTYYTARVLDQWLRVRVSSSSKLFTSMTTQEPITMSGIHQMLKRLKKAAGVKGRVNPHGFRHRFAIEYLMNGGDEITLAKLLGDNIQTVALYYTIFSKDELAAMHDKYTPLKRLNLG